MAKEKITTLAQLRKEHKPAKAYHFTVDKDFVLIFEDYNYFEEELQDEFFDLLDIVLGNTADTVKEIIHAGDDLFKLWVGEEQYERIVKDKLMNRNERIALAQQAVQHFQKEHGEGDPKEKKSNR